MKPTAATWLDRAIGFVAPQRGLRRLRARVALGLLARNYEGASIGRRTSGWRSSISDANAAMGPSLARLREVARDLVRNNAYAESALNTVGDHVVGWGIVGKPRTPNPRAADLWNSWAGTTACDADGRNDMAGLQKLAMRTVVESGEVIVRRIPRRLEDGLPIPLQIQVLEPDYLDVSKDFAMSGPGRIVQGVEFDTSGRRVAYWLFREHPGSVFSGGTGYGSVRVPTSEVLHVFKHSRPGQVRAPTWFAPVLLRFKDFDEYEDATLMKQKIAACLAVITSDVDGTAAPIGTADDTKQPAIDSLEPGMVLNVAPGRSITVVEPPSVREYSDYSRTQLRAIATGLGVTYEDLTGDYGEMSFSAARMSRLRHWARVEDWQWRTLIPQFCDPVWRWAMEMAQIAGGISAEEYSPAAEWTTRPPPMIDPAQEGLAFCRNIRTGIQTLSEALRERGYDPATVFAEMAADNAKLDELGLVLDSDARMTTQAGQPRLPQAQPAPAGDAPAGGDAPPEPPKAPGKKAKRKRIDVRYDSQGRRKSYDVTEE